MNNQDYFDNLNEIIRSYFEILVDEIPCFLYKYIKIRWISRENKRIVSGNCIKSVIDRLK